MAVCNEYLEWPSATESEQVPDFDGWGSRSCSGLGEWDSEAPPRRVTRSWSGGVGSDEPPARCTRSWSGMSVDAAPPRDLWPFGSVGDAGNVFPASLKGDNADEAKVSHESGTSATGEGDDLATLKMSELKRICKSLELKVGGNKDELVQRIRALRALQDCPTAATSKPPMSMAEDMPELTIASPPSLLGKGFEAGAVGAQVRWMHGTVPSALSRCPTKDMSLVSLHCGFSPLTAEAWEIPDDPLPAARICFGMHSHLELLHADSVELARLHDNRVEEAARHEERGRQQRIQQMQMQHLVSLQQQQPQLPLPARTQESATPASDSIKLQQGEQCALNAELDLHPDLKQSLAQFLRSYDQLIAASVQPQEGSQRPAKRPRGVHMPSGV